MTAKPRSFKYLNENFTYTVNSDFDHQDIEYYPREEVDLLRVNFGDGTKVRIYADLISLESGVPEFDNQTVIVFPKLPLVKAKLDIVEQLLRKHSLPTSLFQ